LTKKKRIAYCPEGFNVLSALSLNLVLSVSIKMKLYKKNLRFYSKSDPLTGLWSGLYIKFCYKLFAESRGHINNANRFRIPTLNIDPNAAASILKEFPFMSVCFISQERNIIYEIIISVFVSLFCEYHYV
jgi:hypothetical protein